MANIKIPQAQQRTTLQSTQAARPEVSGPVEAAFGGAQARSVEQLGRALNQAGQTLDYLQRQQRQLRLADFEAQSQLAYKKYNEQLKSANDYQNFGQYYQHFTESLEELGKQQLGDKEYARWAEGPGKLFLGGAQLGTAQIAAQKERAGLKEDLRKTLHNYATLASLENTPERIALYYNQAAKTLEDARFKKGEYEGAFGGYITEEEARELDVYYQKQLGIATLSQDIANKPLQAIENLKNPEMYPTFTPVERQQWLARAQSEERARQGTIKEQGVNTLASEFERLYSVDPTRASQYYQSIIDNRIEYMEKSDLTPEKLNTALGYMEKVLSYPSSEFSLQLHQAQEQSKEDLNRFNIQEDFTIKGEGTDGKSLNNVESVVAYIDKLENQITNGTFYGKDRAVATQAVQQMRLALNKMVEDSPKVKYWKLISNTGSEYLRQQIKAMKEDDALARLTAGEEELYTPQDIGYIYETAFRMAKSQGIDLSQKVRNTDDLKNVVYDAKRYFISNKFGIPKEQVDAAIVAGRLVGLVEQPSGKINPLAKRLDAFAQGYQLETLNGQQVRVRRDNRGNIMDIVYAE